MIIDVHSHLHTKGVEELLGQPLVDDLNCFRRFDTDEGRVQGHKFHQSITPILFSLDIRLKDLDRMGIEKQLISPSPGQRHYWCDPEVAEKIARLENDNVAKQVAEHPDRFFGICVLPLQDMDLALRVLDRSLGELDMKGILIDTAIGDMELSDPHLEPLWARAEELDVPFLLHPHLGFPHGERLSNYYMINITGNLIELTLGLTHLAMGGVLERHPRLKICSVHGGGYLPTHFGRLDRGYKIDARPDSKRHISKPPSEYLKQVFYDTVLFDPDEVTILVNRFGADHVLMSTDYPHDLGHEDPLAFINSMPG
ncbi:MAG: amidohydrolase family protein, partial [Rhodospirillales bacterium]|nr:amidohydrolase family protein [Rhodospirillales bacterium]